MGREFLPTRQPNIYICIKHIDINIYILYIYIYIYILTNLYTGFFYSHILSKYKYIYGNQSITLLSRKF